MGKKMRWTGLVALVALALASTEERGWASCDTCQVCKEETHLTIPADHCAAANNQPGSLCCQDIDTGAGRYCYEYGSACYGIIVDGGGGTGGGAGGGTGCAYQNGWCPAECMSCSSGGRPAI